MANQNPCVLKVPLLATSQPMSKKKPRIRACMLPRDQLYRQISKKEWRTRGAERRLSHGPFIETLSCLKQVWTVCTLLPGLVIPFYVQVHATAWSRTRVATRAKRWQVQ